MATYEFFTNCLNVAHARFDELVKKTRARGGNLDNEIKEILKMIETARDYDEISIEQAIYLINEFKKIDFTKLSKEREAIKEREVRNVGFRNRY